MPKQSNFTSKMSTDAFYDPKTKFCVNMCRLFVIFLCFFTLTVKSDSGFDVDKKYVLKGSEEHSHQEYDRQCRHAHPKADDVVRGVHIEPAHILKKRSLDQPLRIVLHYDLSVYRLDAEKFTLINNTILPEAVQFWERTLMVRKTGDDIRLNRKCSSRHVFVKGGRTHCIDNCRETTTCGEVQVPEEHLNPCYVCNSTGQACRKRDPGEPGQGVANADFVLYVSAIETERCLRGLTVAYAAHCQQESVLDRPIAGHANFCPSELSTRPQELGSMLSTVQHEMLHALGFSVSLYAFYRDDDGNPLTERNPDTGSPPLNEELQIHQWSDKVVKNITRERWMVRGGYMSRNIQVMVTPRVVKEVRNHFECSTLEGAELEDQGGEGTALTHWEKRIMENEAMTGTHTQNPVFSRVTLALMEDTGWYKADYDQAGELNWGKGLGCPFVTRSCKEWIKNASVRPAHPFCSRVKRDPLQTECSQQRESVALCNLVLHDRPLPPLYQHFDWIADATPGTESHYGGSVSLADYCPYTQEFTWRFGSVVVRGSRCSFSDNNPKVDKNFALESYGENSKCFDHTNRMWEQRSCRQVRQWQHWGSGCYEYKCENGRLHIMVGNYSYECYHAGQEMSVRIVRGGWLHRGALLCPPCKDLCSQQFEERGEWCKPGDEAPPNTFYPRDELRCATGSSNNAGGSRSTPRPHALAVSVSLGVLLSFTGLCLCGDAAAWAARLAGKRGEKRSAIKLANMAKTNKNGKFKLEEVVVQNGDGVDTPDSPADEAIEDSKGHENNTSPLNVCAFEDAIRTALGIDQNQEAGEEFSGYRRNVDEEEDIENCPGFKITTVSGDVYADTPKKCVKFCIQNDEFHECCRANPEETFKCEGILKNARNETKLVQLDPSLLPDEAPPYFQLDAPIDFEENVTHSKGVGFNR